MLSNTQKTVDPSTKLNDLSTNLQSKSKKSILKQSKSKNSTLKKVSFPNIGTQPDNERERKKKVPKAVEFTEVNNIKRANEAACNRCTKLVVLIKEDKDNTDNQPEAPQLQELFDFINEIDAWASATVQQLGDTIIETPFIPIRFKNQNLKRENVNVVEIRKQLQQELEIAVNNFCKNIFASNNQQDFANLLNSVLLAVNQASKQLVNAAEEEVREPIKLATQKPADKINEPHKHSFSASSPSFKIKSASSEDPLQSSTAMAALNLKPSSNKIPGITAVGAAALTYYPAALAAKLIPTDYSKVIAGAAALVVGILAFYITKQILHPPSPKAKGCKVIPVQPTEKNKKIESIKC